MKTQKYRVTQIKRHHLAYIFACKGMNLKKHFMFLTHINYTKQQMRRFLADRTKYTT